MMLVHKLVKKQNYLTIFAKILHLIITALVKLVLMVKYLQMEKNVLNVATAAKNVQVQLFVQHVKMDIILIIMLVLNVATAAKNVQVQLFVQHVKMDIILIIMLVLIVIVKMINAFKLMEHV